MLCDSKGSYAMSGRRTGGSTVAWLQAQLVWSVTYDWSVSEIHSSGFPLACLTPCLAPPRPTPGLVPQVRSRAGASRVDVTYLLQLMDEP